MIRYARFDTSLGRVLATARDDAITGVYFDGQRYEPAVDPAWTEDPGHPPLAACAQQLRDYFEGRRNSFELPLAPEGTPFQRRVWEEIARIPFGATLSYAELALRAGSPTAARAAGAATGRNPLSVVVPCHRVVGSAGALTGYAGGLARKARLLEIEGVREAAAA